MRVALFIIIRTVSRRNLIFFSFFLIVSTLAVVYIYHPYPRQILSLLFTGNCYFEQNEWRPYTSKELGFSLQYPATTLDTRYQEMESLVSFESMSACGGMNVALTPASTDSLTMSANLPKILITIAGEKAYLSESDRNVYVVTVVHDNILYLIQFFNFSEVDREHVLKSFAFGIPTMPLIPLEQM